jgi:nucleoside-diphosphate-sugar epimerase
MDYDTVKIIKVKREKMNILITGIHGFVGSNLIASLWNRHTLFGLTSCFKKDKEIEHIYSWDNLTEIPPIDVVIHLAGKAHDTKKQTDRQIYFDINTGLTKKIFDWFLLSTAKKFIFFSSVKVAADTILDDILTEDVIPSPKGPYGESKIAAEEYIKAASVDTTKQVYILRPAMIHGPGNKGNLNLLYNVVCKGIPWPLGAFENRRSFTSVDNLAYIISQLIEQDVASGIYNIADDDTLSTNEIIQLMGKEMSCKCRIWNVNKTLMKQIAWLGGILHLPLNQERLKKLTENYIVSNEKIKKELGITKLPVSARDGFVKTIRSFGQTNN